MKNYEIMGRGVHMMKTLALVILMVLDVYFCFHMLFADQPKKLKNNGTVNNINFSAESEGVTYVIGAHFIVHLSLLFWLFFLVWKTFLFRFRIKTLFTQFAWLFIFFILNFGFYLWEEVMYATKYTKFGSNPSDLYSMWKDNSYQAIFWIRRLGIF